MSDDQAGKAQGTVLVIEDDEIQLKALAGILETEELQPICCRTGQEALAACQQQAVNVAILDLHLPDIDGLQLLKQLKEQNPYIKVIINTGYPSLESAMAAVNEEAFAYVNKMGDLKELLTHIHRAFHVHLADYSEILEKEVKKRTEELLKANEGLKKEIAERKQAEIELERFRTILDQAGEAIFVTDPDTGRFTDVNHTAARMLGYSRAELLNLGIKDIEVSAPIQTQEGLRAHVADIKAAKGPLIDQGVHRRKDGSTFPVEVSVSHKTFEDQDYLLAVVRDITGRKRAEAAEALHREGLRRRARELEELYATSLEINAQLDLSTLLSAIVRRAARLLGTRRGGLFLLQPDGETLELVAGHNRPDDHLGATLHLGEGLAGRIAQTSEPMMVADYHRWQGRVDSISGGLIGRILGVPLKQGDRVIGVLNVFDQEAGAFDQDATRLLSLFAAQAATAIENVRLFEAEHEQHELAEALREVGAALSATLDFDVVLDRLLAQIGRVVPYDAANVALIERGRSRVVRTHGYEQFGEEVARAIAVLSFDIATTANLCWMAETGQPLVIPDIATYPGWVEVKATAHARSWAGAPIMGQGQIIAFFSLDKIEPGFYRPEHAERLAAFAGQAAIALENARLFEQTQIALAHTEALYRTGRSLIAFESLVDVLQTVVDGVAEALPADCVLLYTVNLERRRVDHFVKGGLGSDRIPVASFDELWAGLSGWVLRELKPALSPKGGPDPRESAAVQRLRAETSSGSIIVVPLRYWGQTLGTMTAINRIEQRDFTEQDVELMAAMANQAAIAIENGRLFEETYRWAQQLAMLNELAGEMTGLLEVKDLYETVVQRLCSTFGYDDVGIFAVDPAGRQLVLQAVAGDDVATIYVSGEHRQAFGEGIVGRVAETGQMVAANNIRQHPAFIALEGTNTNAEVAIPLKVGEQVVGVLNVESDQLDAFDETEVAMLTTVTDQLTVALEKARLFEQTRRRAEQLEALRQVSQDLTALRDLDMLLRQIVERAIQLLGGDAGGMFLYRPEREVLELVVMVGEKVPPVGLTHSRGEGLSGKVWATGQPLIVDDYQHWPGRSTQWSGIPASAVVGVPIQWGDEFLGVLAQSNSTERRYTPEDAKLLSQFATQAAIAIENARLHQETRKQARQVQQILDTVPEGILLLDPEHRIKLANPAAQIYLTRLAGVGAGEVLTDLGGQPLAEMLSSPDGSQWHEVTLTGPPQSVFEVGARPMETGPETEGWVVVLHDVTEERAIQERARQQDRLAAVGQLAAGIAHDFNNILTSIIGYAELVRIDPNLSELTRADLGLVVQQGERAAHLIRQILDFSRRSIIEKRSIDLEPFLEETIELLKRTIPEDIRISLEIEPDRRAYMLKADPAQMQQALTNLAVNARDAMPGGGMLQFRLFHLKLDAGERPPCPEMPPGDWVALSISDTGAGILLEHRPHLFEPFFTTKEVGEGTGLGLAQVYGIVKQHEGYIDVESQVGKGATFTLYLPALFPLQEPMPRKAQAEFPYGQGEVILLVEDDPMVLEVTKSMLERLDYRVLMAANGREALEIYDRRQDEIALVLTDVTMPEIGGLALSQALRKRGSVAKVVALTGYPLEEEAKELLAKGIVDWLQKPLNLKQLSQIVSRSLKLEEPS